MIFTPEELAELEAFDAAVEKEFDGCTPEELRRNEDIDRLARLAVDEKAQQNREYYQRHKERIKQTAREYYRKNREKCKAYAREYYRSYYKAHREEILAKRKAKRK